MSDRNQQLFAMGGTRFVAKFGTEMYYGAKFQVSSSAAALYARSIGLTDSRFVDSTSQGFRVLPCYLFAEMMALRNQFYIPMLQKRGIVWELEGTQVGQFLALAPEFTLEDGMPVEITGRVAGVSGGGAYREGHPKEGQYRPVFQNIVFDVMAGGLSATLENTVMLPGDSDATVQSSLSDRLFYNRPEDMPGGQAQLEWFADLFVARDAIQMYRPYDGNIFHTEPGIYRQRGTEKAYVMGLYGVARLFTQLFQRKEDGYISEFNVRSTAPVHEGDVFNVLQVKVGKRRFLEVVDKSNSDRVVFRATVVYH